MAVQIRTSECIEAWAQVLMVMLITPTLHTTILSKLCVASNQGLPACDWSLRVSNRANKQRQKCWERRDVLLQSFSHCLCRWLTLAVAMT